MGVDAADVQPWHLVRQGVLAVMQQQHRPGIRQDVLLTLQRMARLQRQVHRAAAQDRQDSRIQRTAFGQADPDDDQALMLLQQRSQALLDGAAVGVQLAIVEGGAIDAQGRTVSILDALLLQPFDHRRLRKLLQSWVGGGIEAMHEREAIKEPQTLDALEANRFGGFGEPKIVGIARVATDQQRHVVNQCCHGLPTQRLAVTRRFIGDGYTGQQR
ncbi:hypothetical protein D3C78_902900 [compost metagenome]